MNIKLEFKAQDLWIGAYWDYINEDTHLWVCLLPCLPVHLSWKSDRAKRYNAKKYLLAALKANVIKIKGTDQVPWFTLDILTAMLAAPTIRNQMNLVSKISDEQYLGLQTAAGQCGGWWFLNNHYKWEFVKWSNLDHYKDKNSLR